MEFYFLNCKKIKALAPGLVLKNSLLFNVLTLSMMMIFTSSSTSMPFKGTGSQPWQFFVSNIPLYCSLIFCLMVYLFNLLLLQALNNAGNWILKQSWVVLIFWWNSIEISNPYEHTVLDPPPLILLWNSKICLYYKSVWNYLYLRSGYVKWHVLACATHM